jgi:hypothetical protein
MTPNIGDIESWAIEERGPDTSRRRGRPALLDSLISQIERDHQLPQPDALPPGSPERLAAESRQRRLAVMAGSLGYQPAGVEAVQEVVKHVAVAGMPVPEAIKPIVEIAISTSTDGGDRTPDKRKSRKNERSSDGGFDRGLGFSL